MLTINEIKDYFALENSHAKKELGQNFLVKPIIAANIVESLKIKETDNVLEIGPGLGSLTELIIDKVQNFTVCEYDQKFVNYLNKAFENKNVKIVKNNILKFDDCSFNKVLGNLPYYITTDIIEFVTTKFSNLEQAVFMIQKECLERIKSVEGKSFNALNVYLMLSFNIRTLFTVKKSNFFPIPGVDSIVFSLDRIKEADLNFNKSVYKVAKILFSNRRKIISNNLKGLVHRNEDLLEVLKSLGLEANLRAEELKLNDYVNLTKMLLNLKIISW